MTGRQSSIDRLPPDVLEKLQELLRDPRVTQLDATAKINAILEDDGHEERLSKSAVNRYAKEMDRVGKKMREQTAIAKMWVNELGHEPQGESGRLLTQLVRALAFDSTLTLHGMEVAEDDRPGWIKMLKDLALINQRLEAGATLNVKREAEIRKQALEEAANVVEETATQAGVSQDTVKRIREVLGMRA